LKRRPYVVFRFGAEPSARVGALGGLRRQDLALTGFELLSQVCHTTINAEPAETAEKSYSASSAISALYVVISPRKLVPWASGPTPKFSTTV
jgi:hypothetical protein